jgi:upstream activation factor subunit UAF30
MKGTLDGGSRIRIPISARRKEMAVKGKTGTKKAATANKGTKGKTVAKKPAAKKPAKKAAPAKKVVKKRTPNPAFMKAMQPSDALAKIVGSKPLPRTEITKKLWVYIKKNKLQDTKNKRNINADANLTAVFGGKKQVSMFEMTKLVNKHLS